MLPHLHLGSLLGSFWFLRARTGGVRDKVNCSRRESDAEDRWSGRSWRQRKYEELLEILKGSQSLLPLHLGHPTTQTQSVQRAVVLWGISLSLCWHPPTPSVWNKTAWENVSLSASTLDRVSSRPCLYEKFEDLTLPLVEVLDVETFSRETETLLSARRLFFTGDLKRVALSWQVNSVCTRVID